MQVNKRLSATRWATLYNYYIIRIADLEVSSTLITQSVRSGAGNDLHLTSPTHSVNIDGPQQLGIRSFGGGINIEAAKDINIRANNNGKVLHTVVQGY